jgi:hypothetical protein
MENTALSYQNTYLDRESIERELIDRGEEHEMLHNPQDMKYVYKGLKLYTINVKHTPKIRLNAILDECEAVEKSCWDAQEKFHNYAKDKDILSYAVHDGKIVAFQIASYWIIDNNFIFDLDETMVIKQFRGMNLAMALTGINTRTFYLRMCKMKHVNTMTFVGLTPNLKLINLLDKFRYIIQFIKTSFNPSPAIFKIRDSFLEKKGATLVHEDYPFFLKGVFPGSLKPSDGCKNASKRVKKMLPHGLDFNSRGDAYLFLACFHQITIFPIMLILIIKALGFKFLFNSSLGYFSRKKNIDVYKYLNLMSRNLSERHENV